GGARCVVGVGPRTAAFRASEQGEEVHGRTIGTYGDGTIASRIHGIVLGDSYCRGVVRTRRDAVHGVCIRTRGAGSRGIHGTASATAWQRPRTTRIGSIQ